MVVLRRRAFEELSVVTFTKMTPSGQKRGATGVVYINKEICRSAGHQEHVTSVCVATLITVSKVNSLLTPGPLEDHQRVVMRPRQP